MIRDLDFFPGKKIFVTGHTGFKGSWLCVILRMLGAEVTGYALEPPTDPSLFALCGLEKQVRSVTGDVRDFPHLRRAFDEAKPDIVLHLAAQPIVRESYRTPRETYETNVMGTVNLLECVRTAQEPPLSVVNVTTDKVYLNREWAWGYREDEPLDGFDPYSNSKSCSELATHSYRSSFFADGRVAVSTARGQRHRRRRFRARPGDSRLRAGGGNGAGYRCPQPAFHPPLSACSGAAFCLSDDRRSAV